VRRSTEDLIIIKSRAGRVFSYVSCLLFCIRTAPVRLCDLLPKKYWRWGVAGRNSIDADIIAVSGIILVAYQSHEKLDCDSSFRVARVFQEPHQLINRKARIAPPDWSASARSEATSAGSCGPDLLGLALRPLGRLGLCFGHRET